jgi:hypothetical protein
VWLIATITGACSLRFEMCFSAKALGQAVLRRSTIYVSSQPLCIGSRRQSKASRNV